jgi:hypothetical protein
VPVEPPSSLAAISERVAARIDALLAAEQQRWGAVDADMVEPYASLRALVSRGKRLRPAFCPWGWVGAGGDPDDPRIVDAGAALELLHAFAIVHDDIMDGSTRRHGRPCVHVEFADRHAERGWRGEARRFGDGAALLIGDLAFVYADRMMRGAPADAMDVFTELRVEVNVGQYLDLIGTATRNASPARARSPASTRSSGRSIWARRSPDGSTTWPRTTPRTASPSVRRSSSATTCSAPSETPTGSAKGSARTSARASPPRSTRRRGGGRGAPTPPSSTAATAGPT